MRLPCYWLLPLVPLINERWTIQETDEGSTNQRGNVLETFLKYKNDTRVQKGTKGWERERGKSPQRKRDESIFYCEDPSEVLHREEHSESREEKEFCHDVGEPITRLVILPVDLKSLTDSQELLDCTVRRTYLSGAFALFVGISLFSSSFTIFAPSLCRPKIEPSSHSTKHNLQQSNFFVISYSPLLPQSPSASILFLHYLFYLFSVCWSSGKKEK